MLQLLKRAQKPFYVALSAIAVGRWSEAMRPGTAWLAIISVVLLCQAYERINFED